MGLSSAPSMTIQVPTLSPLQFFAHDDDDGDDEHDKVIFFSYNLIMTFCLRL